MNDVVYARIQELCSSKQLKDMYMVDVHEAIQDVFGKMGYTPSKNIDKSVDKAWANSNREDYLCDFIYLVWSVDS